MANNSNRNSEVSILPTLEESKAHGGDIPYLRSATMEEKAAEDESAAGQGDQFTCRTSSLVSRLFPSGSRVRREVLCFFFFR